MPKATELTVGIDFKKLKVTTYANLLEGQNMGNAQQLFKSHEELAKAKGVTGSQLCEVFNAFTGQKVAKFSSKKEGARRLWEVAIGRKTTIPKPKPKPVNSSGFGRTGNRGMVMHPTTETNPYRAGSKSHAAFQMVLDQPGKVFGQYIEDGARVNTLNGAIRDKHIKLSKPARLQKD